MSRFGRSSARASLLALALLSFATSCAGASGWRAAEHKLREQGLLHDVSPGAVTFRADAPGDDAPPPDPLPPAEAKVRAAREILEDPDRRARRRAHRAVRMLREALELDATKREALALLGRAHQLGEGAEMDERLAVSYFERAAELGDPDAHEELALAYSLGWGGLPRNPPRAMAHQYFAALGGSPRAQMALAHRHLTGAGAPASCRAAVLYYEPAASAAVEATRFPGASASEDAGALRPVEKIRLGNLDDPSDGQAARRRERDVVQYYRYSADMGNADAASAVGALLHTGAKGVARDHRAAYRYFAQAAAAGDADAMSHLGHMHANGVGVEANNETALALFRRAAEKGNAHARYGLGYMHLSGFGMDGGEGDPAKAHHYLSLAAEQGSAEAMFHLGALHLRGEVPGIAEDPAKAFYHFTGAAHAGHATAAYNLAMMQLGGSAPGNGAAQLNCRNAANLLKGIAERGRWNAPVERANEAFREGNLDAAYALYAKAAEAGLEVAQANAAHVLETLARRAGTEAERDERLALALRFHKLAADQGNARSLLKVGDAMYYGRGVERDVEAAARVYLRASRQRSAQAMFNLGAAHEHGVGLPKDLHLAKRYYDMVLSTNPKAFLPVRLALWKLAAHAKVVETLERWGWIASASAGAGAGAGATESGDGSSEGASDEDGEGKGGSVAKSARAGRSGFGFWFGFGGGSGDFFSPERHADLALAGGLGVALCAVIAARLVVQALYPARPRTDRGEATRE